MEIALRSYAKINWMLRILGRRDDGFHELETIFQTISLHDRMTFRVASEFELRCSDDTIPTDERNLVTRAWLMKREKYGAPPLHVTIEKMIPSGGGLGGGSSNAAATLLATAKIAGMSVDRDELADLAATLGSDVPFFLHGGTSYATGRGEILRDLPPPRPLALLLLLPDERVSTADAYGWLARERMAGRSKAPDAIGYDESKSIVVDLVARAGTLVNDLEEPVLARLPRLAQLRDALSVSGAVYARMSGSGSTIVGAFVSEEERDRAQTILGSLVRTEKTATIDAAESLADFQRA